MTTLARGQANFERAALRGRSIALEGYLSLLTFHPVTGRPVDVETAEFQVFDLSGGPPGVQTFPASGRASVEEALLVPDGDRVATGHYVARYTVPLTEPLGAHEVRWSFTLAAGGAEQVFTEAFTVGESVQGSASAKSLGTGLYCTEQDVRDEGFTDATIYTSARILDRIALAGRRIELFTGRFFEPRLAARLYDGDDTMELLLDEPLIELSSLRILSSFVGVIGQVDPAEISPEDVLVYNRHLTQGLLRPDDRANPKIAFVPFDDPRFSPFGSMGDRRERVLRSLFFPRGNQNVQIVGVWGYTDPAPNSTSELERRYGSTPLVVREACKRLVVRELPRLADCDEREGGESSYRLTSKRLGNQAIGLEPQTPGAFTGDPEIDRWLAPMRRPVQLAAV